MENNFHIKSENLIENLVDFAKKGGTEFALTDPEILGHKGKLLKFLGEAAKKFPNLMLILPLEAKTLDMDVCRALSQIFCTVDIPLEGSSKGGSYLFDKKFYSRRAETLNNLGLVWGFDMTFSSLEGDSAKLFRDRLDFAISLYPNHIDFPQLDKDSGVSQPKPTGTYSPQEISASKEIAFACRIFYTLGRAVPWFNSIVKAVKMSPSKFFQDFAEWQRVNNCSLNSAWDFEKARHSEIEKMQLKFLEFKFEEKHKSHLFAAASDIIRLNGAYSRLDSDGESCKLDLSYNAEDLMSPASLNLATFCENVCMENNSFLVK